MLAFAVQPSNVTAGGQIAQAVQVVVLDARGNTVTAATNSIMLTITPGTGTTGAVLGGTLTIAAVNGVATFGDVTVDKAGTSYTLTATANGLTSAISTVFGVSPGAATKLAFAVQPSNAATASAVISPAVQVTVQDAQGNTVTGTTNSITLAITPATGTTGAVLGGTLTIAAVNGVAMFSDLTVDRVGTGYKLTATAGGLAPATSTAFLVNGFTSLSVGGSHTCGLTLAGTAYCWGSNARGQLGNGSTTNSSAPVAVSGGITFASVHARFHYSCGVSTSGAAYCWGENSYGELGNGSTTSLSNAPVAVSGGLSFATVSTGYWHACGVTTAGAAYCWGINNTGQLGNASTTSNSSVPLAVSGGLTFATVSAGDGQTCGVTPAGTAYCWGYNSFGQLGDSSTTKRTTPVAVSGGLAYVSVSAGYVHSCGVTTAGAAYCWGNNVFGQLGNGSTTSSTSPVAVSGGPSFATVSAGDMHSCGTTPAGAAYCWGSNSYGQLGNGSTTSSSSPAAVSGGLTFVAAGAGAGTHSCGVTAAGAAYCWGSGGLGQLGNGSTSSATSPVRVIGP